MPLLLLYTISMRNRFQNKHVVLIGGASGMGLAVAQQLAKAGARIIIVDRNARKGNSETKSLVNLGYDVVFKKADMLHESDVKKVFKNIVKEYTHIDFVINSAGTFMAGETRDTPMKNWNKLLELNIFAITNPTHYVYQIMLKQGSGHIVNFASSAGLFPVPAMGIYGASKFAVVGLMQTLRNEAKSLGVKVTVICPTIVNTPLYDTAIYNNVDKQKALKTRHVVQQPDVAAKRIIKGIARNQAIVHTSIATRFGWWAYRLSPALYGVFARRAQAAYRDKLRLEK
jgi:short-subunit dehydrogenase